MDLLLELRDDGQGADLVIRDGDLAMGHTLRAQVLASLFCDGRRLDPLPINPAARDADPRGYWAEKKGDRFGSLLWTHDVGKRLPELLPRLEQDVRAALKWALDSGVVRELTVTAAFLGDDQVFLDVVLERAVPLRFQKLWDEEDEIEIGPFRLHLLVR